MQGKNWVCIWKPWQKQSRLSHSNTQLFKSKISHKMSAFIFSSSSPDQSSTMAGSTKITPSCKHSALEHDPVLILVLLAFSLSHFTKANPTVHINSHRVLRYTFHNSVTVTRQQWWSFKQVTNTCWDKLASQQWNQVEQKRNPFHNSRPGMYVTATKWTLVKVSTWWVCLSNNTGF